MNIDHLIESIHEENALRRRAESACRDAACHGSSSATPHNPFCRDAACRVSGKRERGPQAATLRKVGRFALPAAAVAAVLLIVFLPRGNDAQASTPAPGIYCNSQCNPEDVLALIGNNINHIKQIQQS